MKPQKTIFMSVLLISLLCMFAQFSFQQENTSNTFQTRVSNSAEEICPLLVGKKVPEVILETSEGDSFDLNEAIKEKPAILMFYRGGWCGYCNTQLGQLKDIEHELVEIGYQIFAISPDTPEKLRGSLQKHNMKYRLLYDRDMSAAKLFGIAFKVDDNTVKRYTGAGIELTYDSKNDRNILPVPAVFLVGIDGVIRFQYVNPNYRVRLNSDVLLAAAKAYLKE